MSMSMFIALSQRIASPAVVPSRSRSTTAVPVRGGRAAAVERRVRASPHPLLHCPCPLLYTSSASASYRPPASRPVSMSSPLASSSCPRLRRPLHRPLRRPRRRPLHPSPPVLPPHCPPLYACIGLCTRRRHRPQRLPRRGLLLSPGPPVRWNAQKTTTKPTLKEHDDEEAEAAEAEAEDADEDKKGDALQREAQKRKRTGHRLELISCGTRPDGARATHRCGRPRQPQTQDKAEGQRRRSSLQRHRLAHHAGEKAHAVGQDVASASARILGPWNRRCTIA